MVYIKSAAKHSLIFHHIHVQQFSYQKHTTFMPKLHVQDINNFARIHIDIFLKPINKVKRSKKHKATSRTF